MACAGAVPTLPAELRPEATPWYSRMVMGRGVAGLRLEVMTVVTPAAIAISAAINFVSSPPFPTLESRVAVLTVSTNSGQQLAYMEAMSCLVCYLRMAAVDSTTWMRRAEVSFRGLAVYTIHVRGGRDNPR